MKKYILLIAVFLLFGAVLDIYGSEQQRTYTYGNPDVTAWDPSANDSIGYCADSATATQYCKSQNYDGYSTYGSRYIGPRLDNDRMYVWNGSFFNLVNGFACSYVLSPLTCYVNEKSQPACSNHSSKACYNNDSYWYDSCGNRQNLYENCQGRGCNNGQCQNQPQPCGGNSYKACFDNDVYWYNSCGARDGKAQECYNGACNNGQCGFNPVYPNRYLTCYDNDVYWRDVIYGIQEKYRECGNNSCYDVGSYYCSGNSVYTLQSCSSGGCLNSACYSGGSYSSSRLIQTCGSAGCSSGKCLTYQGGEDYIKNYRKSCYGNDLYWFDSYSSRQGLYKSCSDNNQCTTDSCQNNQCVNQAVCDGSQCVKGSDDYCQACQFNGDGECNCGETPCSFPADCPFPGTGSGTTENTQSANQKPSLLASIASFLNNNSLPTFFLMLIIIILLFITLIAYGIFPARR